MGGLFHVKSYVVAKRPPADVVRKLGEGATAQSSSSSSDRGSKLGDPSQCSSLVATKRAEDRSGRKGCSKEFQDAKETCLNELAATFYEEGIGKLVHLYVASQKTLSGRSRPVV
ncbi:hypothetical protein AVEN_128576-1 [Araneus ventricosus]|uniref:Uncharacterized protein n=1 Tax=Araneus ventricosus TaxID=182803 RepID=A0A4Y2SAZ8_ARAVE|nr:hypothetical protein AVEN_128576-1 [Araneus ventricosus]